MYMKSFVVLDTYFTLQYPFKIGMSLEVMTTIAS